MSVQNISHLRLDPPTPPLIQTLKSGAVIPHLDEANATILPDCDCTAGCVEAKLCSESKSLLEDAMRKRDNRAARLVWLKFNTHQTFFFFSVKWNMQQRLWNVFLPRISLLSLQVDILMNAGGAGCHFLWSVPKVDWRPLLHNLLPAISS